MRIPITFGGFTPGSCFEGYDPLFQAAFALAYVEIPDTYTQIVISQTTPAAADQDKIWVQTDGSGVPLGIFRYADGQWNRIPGAPYYAEDVGLTNAMEIDFPNDFTITALSDLVGRVFLIKPANTNTAAVTLQVNGLAATPVEFRGGALGSGAIQEDIMVAVIYDGTDFQLLTSPSPASIHGSQFITTPGAGNFVVPGSVFSIEVALGGAGGGGGFNGSAKGGGGGGYCVKRWSVTPGQSIPYTVGAGGQRESAYGAGDATDGGDTIFNTSQIADGGLSGLTTGDGGSYSGADYGIDGGKGTFGYVSDKRHGGASAMVGSRGGYTTVGDVLPPEDGFMGGGGCGDTDATNNDASNGGDGSILIKW